MPFELPHPQDHRVLPAFPLPGDRRAGRVLPVPPGGQPLRHDVRGALAPAGPRPVGDVLVPHTGGLLDPDRSPLALVLAPPLVQGVEGRVVHEVDVQFDRDRSAGRDGPQPLGQPGGPEEHHRPLDPHQPLAGAPVADLHPLVGEAVQADEHRHRDPEQHTVEQVDEHHAEHRGGVDGELPVPPQQPYLRDVHELGADDDQHGRERRHRDQLERVGQEQDEDTDPDPVHHRRSPGARSSRHVRGAPHDHLGDRQPAERARDHVRGALRDQFPVQVRPWPRVHPVDRDRGQQRLHAGDERQGEHRQDDGPDRSGRHLGQRELPEGVLRKRDPVDVETERPGGDRRPEHRDQGRRYRLHPPQPRPAQHQTDGEPTDDDRGQVRVGEVRYEGTEVVEGARPSLGPEDQLELADQDRQPDAGEHAVHHRRREGQRHARDAAQPEYHLEDARGDDDPGGRGPAELFDEAGHDHDQAGGRSAHPERGSAERATHDPADHGGDQPRHQRRAGGHGDAQGQGERHQEHHQGCREVVSRQ